MTAKAPGFTVDLGDDSPLEVGGWDGIEGIPDKAKNAQALQQQVDHASVYRQLFSTNAGRYVLNDLIECFFKEDIVRHNDPSGSNSPGLRQGQATVVKRILFMIEFANTGGGKLTGPGAQSEE